MTTIVQTITTSVIHRAWGDIEPKLLATLATGVSASFITEAASYVGYSINPGLAVLLSSLIGLLVGYWKSSTSKVLTPMIPVAIPAPVAAPVVAPVVVAPIAPADPSVPAASIPPAVEVVPPVV
jgi:hypothetical protein